MGPKTCVGFLIINTALVNNKLLTNNRFPAFHGGGAGQRLTITDVYTP